jgi:hypothetical protein
VRHYRDFARFGNREVQVFFRLMAEATGPASTVASACRRKDRAYNHRSGMKTLRLMEAGRLG